MYYNEYRERKHDQLLSHYHMNILILRDLLKKRHDDGKKEENYFLIKSTLTQLRMLVWDAQQLDLKPALRMARELAGV